MAIEVEKLCLKKVDFQACWKSIYANRKIREFLIFTLYEEKLAA